MNIHSGSYQPTNNLTSLNYIIMLLCKKKKKLKNKSLKGDPEIDSSEFYENTHDLQYSTASDWGVCTSRWNMSLQC